MEHPTTDSISPIILIHFPFESDEFYSRYDYVMKMDAFMSFLLLFAPVSSHLIIFGSKEVRMEQLVQCGEEEANTPVRIENVMINYDRTTMKVDAQFVFNTSVDGKIKETYNVTGVTIELKNLKELPLGPGYWKVTGKGSMKNKQLFCGMTQLDIQMQRSRKRQHSG